MAYNATNKISAEMAHLRGEFKFIARCFQGNDLKSTQFVEIHLQFPNFHAVSFQSLHFFLFVFPKENIIKR
jgi:hypothetical protein